MNDERNRKHRAFTLAELLVAIAILGVLAAILCPVLARARDTGRQSVCLSNQRQIGVAMLQYLVDYDDRFPQGVGFVNGKRVWDGQGWAGQCVPYLKSDAVVYCPSDVTPPAAPPNKIVSFGYNINLVAATGGDVNTAATSANAGAGLNSPSRTVLLFEVGGVLANVSDPREGADDPSLAGRNFSAAANGLDNRLYAQRDGKTRIANQYETGYLGGRVPPDPSITQFERPAGRHSGGSNFLLADGHSKWLRGGAVSSGLNASASNCPQDNIPPTPGCGGLFQAAGTEAPKPTVTFSAR
ncbi:MAG: hypothetical protein NVSMB52_20660 [Chloroflexota bacterium]